MKVLKRDLKHGLVEVRTETLDDLWYLSQIVEEGDKVSGRTVRKVKGKDDKLRAEQAERKPMFLEIRVESVEFDQNSNRLRILGSITQGPDNVISLGDHHTFEVGENTQITIIKPRWGAHHLKYLDDAKASSKRARIMVAIIGDGEATVATIRESGVSFVDTRESLGGKYVAGKEAKKLEFYAKLAGLLGDVAEKSSVEKIILGGTGFEKRNFYDYLKEKDAKLAKRCSVTDTGSEGKRGVHEILKGGAADKALSESRIAKEAQYVDKLLTEIAKDGLAAYGFKETGGAVDSGAVDVLLVSDKVLRKDREKVEKLIEKAKSAGGDFHILNSKYEAGERLDGLGGVAALLRFKV